MGVKVKQMVFLGAASTTVAVANVTIANFKSCTVSLLSILLACEPSERKSKDTAACSLKEFFGELRATL